MSRITTIRRDLSALGAMAPVRAGYEVLKRSGAHGALLDAVARRARPVALHDVPAFRPTKPAPAPVRARTLDDAQRIVDQGHRAFGRRVPIEGPGDYAQLIDGPGRWPIDRPWWDIDIRTDARAGDVKWAWEIGRGRDFVILARAVQVDPDGPWAGELAERLRWWFAGNPPERGVQWYSNLEIALRVIVWMQVYALAAGVLPDDVLASMALHVDVARRHILVDFAYTASSMRNNHLLGDSLGLLAIAVFTGAPTDSRSSRMADRFFADQLARHMRTDGSMIEDSLSYHRFVLEMLAIKVLLGDSTDTTRIALEGASRHLVALGCFDGPLPAHGDWDEGRVLASSGDPLSVAGSAALGLTLTGSTRPEWLEDHDEVYWYAVDARAGRAAIESPPGPAQEENTSEASGGIQRVRRGPWRVWFKVGTGPSHQHADLTHVSIRCGEEWITVDPGTGTYNGPLTVRNAFRTSGAHNGLRIEGAEMFEPHRAFRWLTSARTAALPPVCFGDRTVLVGAHDAFARTGGGRIVRVVVVSSEGVVTLDWRECDTWAAMTIACPPDQAEMRVSASVPLSAVVGDVATMTGWHSTTYGQWGPAPWLTGSVSTPGPSWWAVGEAPTPSVAGSVVTIGDLTVSATFLPSGIRLEVADGSRSEQSELALEAGA